jgi:hypothetical protein
MNHFSLIATPKKLFHALLIVLMLSVSIVSCKKGDTGPVGPAGAAGPTGSTGPAGPAGSANVYYSGWIFATNPRDTIIDGSKLKVANVKAPAIVDSILSSGLVMVYFTLGNGIFVLPYTSNAGGLGNTLSFLPQKGNLLITRFTADNSGSIPISASLQYRYIIIPGGKATSSFANATHQGHAASLTIDPAIDYSSMSYADLCSRLHIPQ